MSLAMLLAAIVQLSVLPADLPLAPGTRITTCPAWLVQGMRDEPSSTSIACATADNSTWAALSRQRDHYKAALETAGWTYKQGPDFAATYAKNCDEFELATFPMRIDTAEQIHGTAVFVLALERNACLR